jgi:N-acetylmuramoyl-L-alanine amidase
MCVINSLKYKRIFIPILAISSALLLTSIYSANAAAGNEKSDAPQLRVLSAEDRYFRAEDILRKYPGAAEPDPKDILSKVKVTEASESRSKWLPILDPSGQFSRFFEVKSNLLKSFKDRDSKHFSEFSIPLRNDNGRTLESSMGIKTLKGLRIALDPGHMGTPFWDKKTGKFVHDLGGRTLSEGLLNFQICILLKLRLESLGALVMMTRESLEPVDSLGIRQLDLQKFAGLEFRLRSLGGWFAKFLEIPTLSDSGSNFSNNQRTHLLLSEDMRETYFINRADIFARAKKISSFRPDLTLIIHLDAADSEGADPALLNQHVPDRTRGYIPGAYSETDFATGAQRAEFLAEYLQPERLEASRAVTREIVNSISNQLKIPLEQFDGTGTVKLDPGVFARNLELTRMVTEGSVSYLECLMYGSESEFQPLLAQDYSMKIGNDVYTYSQRLKDLSEAIITGLLSYYEVP